MATYLELKALRNNSDLQDKVEVACVKKAQTLIDLATPTAAQITWAQATIRDPQSESGAMLNYILVANSTLTTAQILAASDSAIQGQINDAVDAIIAGGA